MALIIDINTDELENAVQIARQANAALTEVAELLNSIVIHNDWQCTTRDRINDNTSRNRQQSMQLQNDAEALYNSINYASQEFQAAERTIASSFDAVDGLISGFLSHTPSLSGNTIGLVGKVAQQLGGAGLMHKTPPYDSSVNVIGFADIAKGVAEGLAKE